MIPDGEWLVYLALGVVVAGFVGIFFLMGPVGWILAIVVLLLVGLLAKWSGLLPRGEAQKVSCRACGARNAHDGETCHHCDERLPTESDAANRLV